MAVNDPMSNGTRSVPTTPTTQPYQASQAGMTPQPGQMGGAGQPAQAAKETVGQVAAQAQQQAGQVVEQVKRQGMSQLSAQKTTVAQSIQGVAQAADQFSQQLRQSNQDSLAGYVSQASGQLQRASSYLNNNDITNIVDDVEDFARRQPALFIGGAFLLGALAARFLKSSDQSAQGRRSPANGSARGRASYRAGAQSGYRSGYRPGYRGGPANGQFTTNQAAERRTSDTPWERDNGTTLGYYDPGTTGEDVREVRF